MAPMDDITDRLSEFKSSGLIADYEVMVADDSVRVRIVAPQGQDAAKVKSFVVETLAGKLSESQVSIDEATE
jgi:fructose 1,6-bisphosphatase